MGTQKQGARKILGAILRTMAWAISVPQIPVNLPTVFHGTSPATLRVIRRSLGAQSAVR